MSNRKASETERSAGPSRRVAIVASFAPSLLRFRGDLIGELHALGHEVLCLAPDIDSKVASELRGLGAEYDVYPLARRGMNPLADLASLAALRRAFRHWRPHVVTGYTPKAAIYAAIAAGQTGASRIVPMITGLGYAFQGGDGGKQRMLRWIATRLYKRAFAVSHAAIFHNSDDVHTLRRHGALTEHVPVHLVGGSGVNRSKFPMAPLPPLETGLTFLMVARLIRQKGVLEFCEAARQLRAMSPGSRFVLAGAPEAGEDGISPTQLASYADCVEVLGHRDDIAQLLASCHVFVLPSYGEGLPRTILEAMSVGRPIITTNAPGCGSTIEPDRNGLIAPARDVAGLRRCMEQMLRRPDRIAGMAARSLEIVAERYEVGAVNRRTLVALGL